MGFDRGCCWPTISRLFFIPERNTGFKFLVDTGAEVSVVPLSHVEKQHPHSGFQLQAVNNTSISRSMTLNLGLRCTFWWVFVVADIKHQILGANFLKGNNLLVDSAYITITEHRPRDNVTRDIAQSISSTS